MTTLSLNHYLILSAVLFSLGTLGVILRRNVLIVLMSVELMLNAANLAIVAFMRYPLFAEGSLGEAESLFAGNGMVFVFLVMAVSAAEVGVGLALLLNLFHQRETVNIEDLDLMKG